ncbi:MAG: nucleotide exchange factor GrpE [Proteobacteria bacterium]|nr:nucleotide exchange factor GrpE [Pseudomonadota bacterium]
MSETDSTQPEDTQREESTDGQQTTDAGTDAEISPDSELAEALREKEQFKRLAQRAQADLVNYRRRIEAEQESSRLRNQQRIVLRFADVIDQLETAIKIEVMKDADSSWLEGISAIQKNFESAIAAEGFKRFDSVGEDFDPRKHEALLSSPSADHEPNTVIKELRPGYLQYDQVVRPAQVEIATEPDEDEQDDSG